MAILLLLELTELWKVKHLKDIDMALTVWEDRDHRLDREFHERLSNMSITMITSMLSMAVLNFVYQHFGEMFTAKDTVDRLRSWGGEQGGHERGPHPEVVEESGCDAWSDQGWQEDLAQAVRLVMPCHCWDGWVRMARDCAKEPGKAQGKSMDGGKRLQSRRHWYGKSVGKAADTSELSDLAAGRTTRSGSAHPSTAVQTPSRTTATPRARSASVVCGWSVESARMWRESRASSEGRGGRRREQIPSARGGGRDYDDGSRSCI